MKLKNSEVSFKVELDQVDSSFDDLVEEHDVRTETVDGIVTIGGSEANVLALAEAAQFDIDEVKASFGVDAEVSDPVSKTAKAPGKAPQKGDKAGKAKQGSSDEKVASVPKTKVDMIQKIADAVKGMKKEDLGGSFGRIMSELGVEGYEDELSEDDSKSVSIAELKKITSKDVDVSADVKAMFEGGDELSEDFIEKATTIFETAVVAKVNEIIETITIDIESDREADRLEVQEQISEAVDKYLDYVAQEYMSENALQIEQGIRAEITENFMAGLHNLFTENYIDIPEEKADLVEELAAKVEELEESVKAQINKNVELTGELAKNKKDIIFTQVSEGLAETQAEKFLDLVEGVDFIDEESYTKKITVIRENYFPANGDTKSKKVISESVDSIDEEIELDDSDEKVDPRMAPYMRSISKSVRK